jgi:hypothetical protein
MLAALFDSWAQLGGVGEVRPNARVVSCEGRQGMTDP